MTLSLTVILMKIHHDYKVIHLLFIRSSKRKMGKIEYYYNELRKKIYTSQIVC